MSLSIDIICNCRYSSVATSSPCCEANKHQHEWTLVGMKPLTIQKMPHGWRYAAVSVAFIMSKQELCARADLKVHLEPYPRVQANNLRYSRYCISLGRRHDQACFPRLASRNRCTFNTQKSFLRLINLAQAEFHIPCMYMPASGKFNRLRRVPPATMERAIL